MRTLHLCAWGYSSETARAVTLNTATNERARRWAMCSSVITAKAFLRSHSGQASTGTGE